MLTLWAYKAFSPPTSELLSSHRNGSWLLPGGSSPLTGSPLPAFEDALYFEMSVTNITQGAQLWIWGGYTLYNITGLARLGLQDKGMNLTMDWRVQSQSLLQGDSTVDASKWQLFLRIHPLHAPACAYAASTCPVARFPQHARPYMWPPCMVSYPAYLCGACVSRSLQGFPLPLPSLLSAHSRLYSPAPLSCVLGPQI